MDELLSFGARITSVGNATSITTRCNSIQIATPNTMAVRGLGGRYDNAEQFEVHTTRFRRSTQATRRSAYWLALSLAAGFDSFDESFADELILLAAGHLAQEGGACSSSLVAWLLAA